MKAAALGTAVLLLAGCAAAPADESSGTVTVFAAASLTEVFAEVAEAFTAEHPGVEVVFSFGGSSGLAAQIEGGAPADVFAAANEQSMDGLEGATVFATNTLEIATPPGNPGAVEGLADLARPELAVALCAVEVPCGAAAETVLVAAGVTASVDTYEQDVRAVLTKVELGEVDAGLVYRTDVISADDAVEGIEFAAAELAVGRYPIVALSDSEAAAAFVAFVLSPAGQRILGGAGFGAP